MNGNPPSCVVAVIPPLYHSEGNIGAIGPPSFRSWPSTSSNFSKRIAALVPGTRVRGQSISTVVERAIQEAADNALIRINNSFGNSYDNTWKDYWHLSEGIRFLMVASDTNLYWTFDEEYKVSFAKTHWPFFYTN
jgi:hypothetical protein